MRRLKCVAWMRLAKPSRKRKSKRPLEVFSPLQPWLSLEFCALQSGATTAELCATTHLSSTRRAVCPCLGWHNTTPLTCTDERLNITFDITFPHMPCQSMCNLSHTEPKLTKPVLSLDVMDVSGEFQRDISHDVVKTRLSANGKKLSSSALRK